MSDDKYPTSGRDNNPQLAFWLLLYDAFRMFVLSQNKICAIHVVELCSLTIIVFDCWGPSSAKLFLVFKKRIIFRF